MSTTLREDIMPDNIPCIQAHGIGHRHPHSPWLFRDLDFTLRHGEVTALCGPSGCGKSTLLSLLAGFEKPSEGELRSVNTTRIRWVFQNPHGVAHRTALDHVVQPLLARNRTRMQAEEEALAILSVFRLAMTAGSEFCALSGGEAQRLMLARALASKPDLLLVDEPTAQLDPKTASEVNRTLVHLAEESCIVVIATHDASTRDACTRVIDLTAHHHGGMQ